MIIETKYNIGNEVWMHLGNECIHGKIIELRIYVRKKETREIYDVFVDDELVPMLGELLFPTKEELLKSL
jgi:hypothetical protein